MIFAWVAPAAPLSSVPGTSSRGVVTVKTFKKKRVSAPKRLGWPVKPWVYVTSSFGPRMHPIDGVYRRHAGIDLAAEWGQPVLSAGAGKVIGAGWRGAHGLQIEVRHPNGTQTRYSHLAELLVEPGALVEAGSLIGLAGDTGYATGVHLHFEVWAQGRPRNPMQFMKPTPRRRTLRSSVARVAPKEQRRAVPAGTKRTTGSS
ncbi:MAG: M23 family metallopeptidase [Myxococcaceae bacterium]